MKIKTRFKGYEVTDEIKEYAEKRIGFSLGRFSSQIQSIDFRLIDENGPRGGIDQKCQIMVRLNKSSLLRVESLEDSWQKAVDVAADRIDRMVARHFEYKRALRFQSGMVPKEGVIS